MQLFTIEINDDERKKENDICGFLNKCDEDRLLNESIENLIEECYQKYKYGDLPIIKYDDAYLKEEPVIDRNNISFNILIPLGDNYDLFKFKPSSQYLMWANYNAFVDISEKALNMPVNISNNINFEIDDYIVKTIDDRRKYIDMQYEYLKKDIIKHNRILNDFIDREFRKLVAKVSVKKQLVEKTKKSKFLKIISKQTEPIKIVETKIETYSDKVIKQEEKSNTILTLEKESYIQIYNSLIELSIYANRLPKSYYKLDEEEIRDQIVNALNLKLKTATATGETFNVRGKTDIIIVDNKVIYFVAECKIWKGISKFDDAIDQLMSYVSEDVCYSSIIVFNKTKKKINELVTEKMKERKEFCEVVKENRFLFTHPKNNNLKLEISTIIFDVYYK